jgi:hypothetical protein
MPSISKLIRVKYLSKDNGSVKYLRWPRGIRIIEDKSLGVNVGGNVYPLYKDNFIDFDELRSSVKPLAECPFASKKDVDGLINSLAAMDSSKESEVLPEVDLVEISQEDETSESSDDVPSIVYTEPLIKKVEDPDGQTFDLKIIFDLKYVPVETCPSFPSYQTDWHIERTDWYAYFLINDNIFEQTDHYDGSTYSDSDRLLGISEVLSNPRAYRLYDSHYINFYDLFEQHKIERAKYKNEILQASGTTPFKNVMLGLPVDLPDHITFYDKWGELDFEERASTRPADNGKTYQWWYRFDLSWSDEALKALFTDIFKAITLSREHHNEGLSILFSEVFPYSLERLHQPNVFSSKPDIHSFESAGLEETENLKIINKDISQEIEILKTQKDDETLKLWEAEETITKLKDRIQVYKEREKQQISRTLNNFLMPEIYIPRRSLKTLENDFRNRDSVYQILNSLIKDERSVKFKNANAAEGWKEVDKKISTGQDEQGRMYVGEIKQQDTKFIVMIGHKKNQSKDFEYMKKNHPSKMIEDK